MAGISPVGRSLLVGPSDFKEFLFLMRQQ
jgi:hypothetical protein